MGLADVKHFYGIFRQGQCGHLIDILPKTGGIFLWLILILSSSIWARNSWDVYCLGYRQGHLRQPTGATALRPRFFYSRRSGTDYKLGPQLSLSGSLDPFSVIIPWSCLSFLTARKLSFKNKFYQKTENICYLSLRPSSANQKAITSIIFC